MQHSDVVREDIAKGYATNVCSSVWLTTMCVCRKVWWSDGDGSTTDDRNNDDAEIRSERHWTKMESAKQRPTNGKLEKSNSDRSGSRLEWPEMGVAG